MSKYSADYLRQELREQGLSSSGNKGELMERLYDYESRQRNRDQHRQRPSQMEGYFTNYQEARSERGVIARRQESKVRRGNIEFTSISEWSMDMPRGSGSSGSGSRRSGSGGCGSRRSLSGLLEAYINNKDQYDECERRGRGSSRPCPIIDDDDESDDDMFGPSERGSRGRALGWY